MSTPLLSVVIPTRNEAANIVRCIEAFEANRRRGRLEVLVVDNDSDDDTVMLSRKCGVEVYRQGPERCAQRNRGWQVAKAPWVMFVDADMEVPGETQDEILATIAPSSAKATEGRPLAALYVRETRVGKGFRIRCRNFERSFYDGTCIDGLRVFRRDVLARLGGYDRHLTACEDWDLDLRVIKAYGHETLGITKGCLYHHEELVSLGKLLSKKGYYAKSMDKYRSKWRGNLTAAKQFSPWYRYAGVFLEHGKWKRVLAHPVLFAGVMFERVLVGLVWIFRKKNGRGA